MEKIQQFLIFVRSRNVDHIAAPQSFHKTDIHQLVKFHVLLQKSLVETHAALKEGLKASCPFYETVR